KRVSEIVAEPTLPPGRAHQTLETVPSTGLPKDVEAAEHQHALPQRRNRRDPNTAVPIERPAALLRIEQVIHRRRIHDAGRNLPILFQPDQRSEIGDATDEVLGTVDGVDDPAGA